MVYDKVAFFDYLRPLSVMQPFDFIKKFIYLSLAFVSE